MSYVNREPDDDWVDELANQYGNLEEIPTEEEVEVETAYSEYVEYETHPLKD